jgi:hypothetical protein
MNVVAPLMLLPEESRGDGPLKVSTSQTRIVFKDLKGLEGYFDIFNDKN